MRRETSILSLLALTIAGCHLLFGHSPGTRDQAPTDRPAPNRDWIGGDHSVDRPAAGEPTVGDRTILGLDTSRPADKTAADKNPALDKAIADKNPALDKPIPDKNPALDKAIADKNPALDKPIPDKPVPDMPIPDKPVPDKPVPDKPVPDKPVPDKPVPDKKSAALDKPPVVSISGSVQLVQNANVNCLPDNCKPITCNAASLAENCAGVLWVGLYTNSLMPFSGPITGYEVGNVDLSGPASVSFTIPNVPANLGTRYLWALLTETGTSNHTCPKQGDRSNCKSVAVTVGGANVTGATISITNTYCGCVPAMMCICPP